MQVLRFVICMLAASSLIALGVPPMAAAQATPHGPPSLSDSLTGEAKAEYEAARLLFGDTDYQGALVKFEHALAKSGDARLLWNMAVCEKNLRHYVRVLMLLERYRREAGATLSDSQRADVQAVLQTVQSLISELRLTVDQPGAEVYVDDVSQGVTPLSGPILVDLGSRRLRVVKRGFEPWEKTRDFEGHSIVVENALLRPLPTEGQLSIFAESDTTIRIDQRIVGTVNYRGSVPAGQHSVRIDAPGKLPFTRDLTIAAGESRTLHVSLQSESHGISPWVWVGASVLVAGGLATGGYFLVRSTPTAKPEAGTLVPSTISIPN
jgi:hypothetical protein